MAKGKKNDGQQPSFADDIRGTEPPPDATENAQIHTPDPIRALEEESKKILTRAMLHATFPAGCVKWRAVRNMHFGSKSLVRVSLDPFQISDRLDDVFGVMGWSVRFKGDSEKGYFCTITVRSESMLTSVDKEGAGMSMQEAMEEAAALLGIGKYLRKVSMHWCDMDGSVVVKPPELPDWAVPPKGGKAPYYFQAVDYRTAQFAYSETVVHSPEKVAAAAEKVFGSGPVADSDKEAEEGKKKAAEQEPKENALKKEQAEKAAKADAKRKEEFATGRMNWWRTAWDKCDTPTEATKLIGDELPHETAELKAPVWAFIQQCITAAGWRWDKNAKAVYDPNAGSEESDPNFIPF